MHCFHRLAVALLFGLTLLSILPPGVAHADAPGTRGNAPQAQGGTLPHDQSGGASSSGKGGISTDAPAWQGVRMLPPPAAMDGAARAVPVRMQQTTTGGTLLPWLNRDLNPGNWILDAGLGIFTAITASIGELFQSSAMSLMGGSAGAGRSWSVIPASCADGALYNIVFCTPPELTYAHAGVRNVWGVLRAVATGLVTVLFLVRIGRMLGDGSRALAAEAKPLVVSFVCVMLFVQGTEWVCQFLVDVCNAISSSILANASVTFPAQGDTPFNIGASIMALFFWLLVLILALKSLFRVIGIAVLIGVAPLAGAMLMERATAGRFRSWLEKLIELLLEQVSVVIVMTVAAAMLAPIQGAGGGDQFVQFLMGTLTMMSALFGPSAMVGIASGAGGGYLASMLQMRVIGAVQKAGVAGRRALGSAAIAGGSAALSRISGHGGDPTLSAAAIRMAGTGALRAGTGEQRRDHLPFRLPERESRNAAHHGGIVSGDAARKMQRRGLAGGSDLSRPPIWGSGVRDPETGRIRPSARGQERRLVYAQALSETRARHAAERSRLTDAIHADGQFLAAQPATADAERETHERLLRNETRLRALSVTSAADGTAYDVTPVTRQEAAALARQRWAQREATRRARPAIVPRGSRPAGAMPRMRRVSPPPATRSIARHPRRSRHVPMRRAGTAIDEPATVVQPAVHAQLRDLTPDEPAAHRRARAGDLAGVQRQRASEAAGRARSLRREAAAAEGAEAARAADVRRQAQEQMTAYRRHAARAVAYQAAAEGRTTRRPSPWTTEQRDARRAAFRAIREEVRAAHATSLPEDANDDAERLRRARLIGETVRQLARERLGELAEPRRSPS